MINPPQNQTALDGKDATIACVAEGAPAPNVTWFYNGKKKYTTTFLFPNTMTTQTLLCEYNNYCPVSPLFPTKVK